MKVRCVELKNWADELEMHSTWLAIGCIYHVLAIEITPSDTMYRILGNEPVAALFQTDLFEVISTILPVNWIASSTKQGFVTLGPATWAEPGFLEAYYDRDPTAISCFEVERQKIISSDP